MTSNDKKVLIVEANAPSYLVTDHGKRAWFARETRLANLSVEMFDFILENTPHAKEIAEHFPTVDSADISDCMWKLIDQLFIEILPDRRLAVIGADSVAKL
jgi:hypothetical protein